MFRRLSSRKMDPIAVTNADDPRTYWSITVFLRKTAEKRRNIVSPLFPHSLHTHTLTRAHAFFRYCITR